MIDGRHTFGVVLPILKGRQLRIHGSDSQWFFPKKRILVTQITTARIGQIEKKGLGGLSLNLEESP